MTTKRTYEDDLQGILDHAGKAGHFLGAVSSAEELQEDERTLFAIVRALEVIGEAAKRVPSSVRGKHPEIPWRGMAGMRDKVIHGYFGVDAEAVWRTVREDLPALRQAISVPLADRRAERRRRVPTNVEGKLRRCRGR